MRGDFRELAQEARAQGWRVEETRGHLKWLGPNGGVVISSSTPSDRRAIKNHVALLRRWGFKSR